MHEEYGKIHATEAAELIVQAMGLVRRRTLTKIVLRRGFLTK